MCKTFEGKICGKICRIGEICDALYGKFFRIFPAYATSSDGESVMIISGPFLHSFDIFDFNFFNV